MFKKGQGATEYMIILAVVIIIALIVVGAMGGIPGIGVGAKSRASASFWQTADIAIPSYSQTPTDLTVNIRNNLRSSISITSVIIGGTTMTGCTPTLAAGQTTTCTIAKTCANAGDAFAYGVDITYDDLETNAEYTFTGEGQKLEGKCANA